jgi:hypothetical protein
VVGLGVLGRELTSTPADDPCGTSAIVVAAPGGVTSIQRWPSPKEPSMRVSNPSVPV